MDNIMWPAMIVSSLLFSLSLSPRVIVETDPSVIVHRIAVRVSQHISQQISCVVIIFYCFKSPSCFQIEEGAFSEQSMKQVLQSAKENLKWSLLKT